MDSEVAAHAFEPFFTTRPDAAAGSGLGLAQVYGFARQSGGAARIDSAPGEGTTVDLFLPSAPAPAAVPEAAAPPAVEPAAAPQGLRVLLVDDDDAVRATAEGLLLDLGFEVLTAADGPAALSVLERDPQVRLLLTDVVMPGMSGVELARAATARRPDLRVLLSTGYAAEGVVEDAGDWPVLRKPYRLDALDRAARRAMA
jgi:CheY-like chemotaxis protein